MITATAEPTPILHHKWLRRAGALSFWFFFIKGILWMAAPLVFYFLA
jgi:hypothetical protein